jgi:hypothetical protein
MTTSLIFEPETIMVGDYLRNLELDGRIQSRGAR